MHRDVKVAIIGAAAIVLAALLAVMIPLFSEEKDGERIVIETHGVSISQQQMDELKKEFKEIVASEVEKPKNRSRREKLVTDFLKRICSTGGSWEYEVQLDRNDYLYIRFLIPDKLPNGYASEEQFFNELACASDILGNLRGRLLGDK